MSPSAGRSGNPPPGRRRRRRKSSGGGATGTGGTSTGATNPNPPAGGVPATPSTDKANPGPTGAGPTGTAGPKRRARAAAAGAASRRRGGRRLRTVDEISAGGLVVDAAHASAALIGRLDRRGRLLWSLPKGHLEADETPEQAAIREVAEETGILGRVIAPLGTIDYWFVAEDRRVHKTVHHFLMEAVGGELCDEDVEVTEVAWVPLTELDRRLAYADERRLVRLAADLLTESA